MWYKFSQMTQSLGAASQEAALGMLNVGKAVKPVKHEPRTPVPAVSGRPQGGYAVPNSTRYRKFMEKQTIFCNPDGKLVWQKLPTDRPTYYLITAGVLITLALSLNTIRQLAAPPKNE